MWKNYVHAAHLHIYHIIRYEYKCFERLILNSTLNANNVIASVPNLRVALFFTFYIPYVCAHVLLDLGITDIQGRYTRRRGKKCATKWSSR